MAGDWIKIRTDLSDDPNVYILSDILDLNVPTVVGHLTMFWGWMDRHTADGKGIKLSDSVIDRKMSLPGFASAMREVGWLEGPNMALTVPKFDRHNGMSAKARALESEAKRLRRNEKNAETAKETKGKAGTAKSGKKDVRQASDKKGSKSPTREEKRREELNTEVEVLNNIQPGDLSEFAVDRFNPKNHGVEKFQSAELDDPLDQITAEFILHHRDAGTVANRDHWTRLFEGWVSRRVLPPSAGGGA